MFLLESLSLQDPIANAFSADTFSPKMDSSAAFEYPTNFARNKDYPNLELSPTWINAFKKLALFGG